MPGLDRAIHAIRSPGGRLLSRWNQCVGVDRASCLPLALGGVVIAARIIMHGARMIAVCSAVGAGEIFDPINEVGVGVAQAGGIARVAEAAGGRKLDLHQSDAAAASDQMRPIAALAHDHAMHQGFSGTPLAWAWAATIASYSE